MKNNKKVYWYYGVISLILLTLVISGDDILDDDYSLIVYPLVIGLTTIIFSKKSIKHGFAHGLISYLLATLIIALAVFGIIPSDTSESLGYVLLGAGYGAVIFIPAILLLAAISYIIFLAFKKPQDIPTTNLPM